MATEQTQEFNIDELINLNLYNRNGKKSIFKYAFILAIFSLFEKNQNRENKFIINDELNSKFIYYVHFLDPTYYGNPCIEYPFFHLQTDKIWSLKYKNYEYIKSLLQSGKRLTKKRILEYVEYGALSENVEKFIRNAQNRKEIMDFIIESQKNISNQSNPFVIYLNTMQSIQGNNTSALAEYQSLNENFTLIEEEHPLSRRIADDLLDSKHVILTGHAGDGKSTIAVEVYKKLAGLLTKQPLSTPLAAETHIASCRITIVKDLSENSDTSALLDKVLNDESTYLLVTNTGALLTMLKEHSHGNAELESKLLEKLQSERAEFEYQGSSFIVYNLACMDNLPLARNVFHKMLADENWRHCEQCSCKESCPILLNRKLLVQDNFRAVERIFLIYRRLLAYGTRLTMRQLMEHLAWTITGGKSLCDIRERFSSPSFNGTDVHLFHNLFFGDNGFQTMPKAQHMKAIEAIRSQDFGTELAPEQELRLWSESSELPSFGMPERMHAELKRLKKRGLQPTPTADCQPPNLVAASARAAIRRIIYFHGEHNGTDSDVDAFLASPFTRRWAQWKAAGTGPGDDEKRQLWQELVCVLKEHFSGQKSGEDDSEYLYITQHRTVPGLRQSVQLLTAKIHLGTQLNTLIWENGKLVLRHALHKGVFLEIDIAFLDYVRHRYCGVLSESLQRAFQQRLDNFKIKLLELEHAHPNDEVTLLRTLANNTKDSFSCIMSPDGKMRIM